MKSIEVDLSEIKPYPGNPRNNRKAVSACAASIRRFGYKNPILVDSDMVIICGHTRRLAALSLGLTEVPVTVAYDMTDEEARAYRLADNRVAELAGWDVELLREELAKITGVDLSGLGFDKNMLQGVQMESLGIKRHVCPRCGAEWSS